MSSISCLHRFQNVITLQGPSPWLWNLKLCKGLASSSSVLFVFIYTCAVVDRGLPARQAGERGIRGVMCYLLLLRARAAQCVTCAYHGHVAQHAPPPTPVRGNLEPSNYFSRLQVSLCLAMAICRCYALATSSVYVDVENGEQWWSCCSNILNSLPGRPQMTLRTKYWFI